MNQDIRIDLPILVEGEIPDYSELDNAIASSVGDAMSEDSGRIGILLSGGVDSTLLLSFALRNRDVPVFTVVTDISHPDLEAAQKLAREYNLKHYVIIPTKEELSEAYVIIGDREKFGGDAAVYIALKLARDNGIDTILASDGIDELTGGYWWHANNSDKFVNKEEAFTYFWDKLYYNHIAPMLDSADKVGINVKFPFLDRQVVSTINHIPLDMRVREGVPKSWWKDFAQRYVPSWVVGRKKIGFVSALQEDITSQSDFPLQWEIDYAKEDIPTKKAKKVKKNHNVLTEIKRMEESAYERK